MHGHTLDLLITGLALLGLLALGIRHVVAA
jgi:hypothetical protein